MLQHCVTSAALLYSSSWRADWSRTNAGARDRWPSSYPGVQFRAVNAMTPLVGRALVRRSVCNRMVPLPPVWGLPETVLAALGSLWNRPLGANSRFPPDRRGVALQPYYSDGHTSGVWARP